MMEQTYDKFLYRVTAQSKTDDLTQQVNFFRGLTYEEVKEFARNEDLFEGPMEEHYQNFVIEPICTEAEWQEGVINFCPRCGQNIAFMKIGRGDIFKCSHCQATVNCNIVAVAVVQNL
jgi:hypothetical protein